MYCTVNKTRYGAAAIEYCGTLVAHNGEGPRNHFIGYHNLVSENLIPVAVQMRELWDQAHISHPTQLNRIVISASKRELDPNNIDDGFRLLEIGDRFIEKMERLTGDETQAVSFLQNDGVGNCWHLHILVNDCRLYDAKAVDTRFHWFYSIKPIVNEAALEVLPELDYGQGSKTEHMSAAYIRENARYTWKGDIVLRVVNAAENSGGSVETFRELLKENGVTAVAHSSVKHGPFLTYELTDLELAYKKGVKPRKNKGFRARSYKLCDEVSPQGIAGIITEAGQGAALVTAEDVLGERQAKPLSERSDSAKPYYWVDDLKERILSAADNSGGDVGEFCSLLAKGGISLTRHDSKKKGLYFTFELKDLSRVGKTVRRGSTAYRARSYRLGDEFSPEAITERIADAGGGSYTGSFYNTYESDIEYESVVIEPEHTPEEEKQFKEDAFEAAKKELRKAYIENISAVYPHTLSFAEFTEKWRPGERRRRKDAGEEPLPPIYGTYDPDSRYTEPLISEMLRQARLCVGQIEDRLQDIENAPKIDFSIKAEVSTPEEQKMPQNDDKGQISDNSEAEEKSPKDLAFEVAKEELRRIYEDEIASKYAKAPSFKDFTEKWRVGERKRMKAAGEGALPPIYGKFDEGTGVTEIFAEEMLRQAKKCVMNITKEAESISELRDKMRDADKRQADAEYRAMLRDFGIKDDD